MVFSHYSPDSKGRGGGVSTPGRNDHYSEECARARYYTENFSAFPVVSDCGKTKQIPRRRFVFFLFPPPDIIKRFFSVRLDIFFSSFPRPYPYKFLFFFRTAVSRTLTVKTSAPIASTTLWYRAVFDFVFSSSDKTAHSVHWPSLLILAPVSCDQSIPRNTRNTVSVDFFSKYIFEHLSVYIKIFIGIIIRLFSARSPEEFNKIIIIKRKNTYNFPRLRIKLFYCLQTMIV